MLSYVSILPGSQETRNMKIIIHGGTHKTGSTTIQRTFSQLQQELYCYAPTWGPAGPGSTNHHNASFLLCFGEQDERWGRDPMFHNAGKTRDQLLVLREQQLATLTAALERNTKPVCLFSLEDLTMSNRVRVQNFAEYCRQFATEVQVIVYVRAPVAYMQSQFSQQAKMLPEMRTTPLLGWPNYRQRLEPVLEAFGAASVRFKFYHRDCLTGGDVALDFAAEIGVPLSPSQVMWRNEGLSREAVALAYAFKTLLPPRVASFRQERQRFRFARGLNSLGTEKLQFTPATVAPLLSQHRADLDWVAQQLGTRIEDPPQAAAGQIGSLSELHELALAQTEAVEELAGLTAPTGSSRQQRLLFALCALYDLE